ncbi:alpha/beta fold hydrolase [Roseateles cellulosilyticus]|uniref:Alpha/beta hydrolase n=1 Tax=Pelomonas cellulosilytica TaxID=2906762 RepID=A0ABS8Y0I0_9BURK|nr:alpha/beta hydrolase [Pelomonas sp. P8]MCE4556557.1 alpha/beta hydrolase [Pelomonas sp. P8]
MTRSIRRALAAGIVTIATASVMAAPPKPTIVLVHGAFAGSSSWNGVVAELIQQGYTVIAAANPLRSVATDGAYVAALARSVDGPVVLVGHSYGGAVISAAANGLPNAKALVFVAAFSPDQGESALALTAKFPGSTLPPTLAVPVKLADGGEDLYVQQDKFPQQFAADVPLAQAQTMAATQRPIKATALSEAAPAPAWKDLPSWAIYGTGDLNIPPQAMAFMAERAKAKRTVVVKDGSHALMVSHPREVAALIVEAARSSSRD